MTSLADTFRPAPWLPGPHAQTLWGYVVRSKAFVPLSRERLDTPDGDELWLDSLDGDPHRPRLLLVHGLEGSSYSAYAQRILRDARRRGLSATVLHFRSCALREDDRRSWIPNHRHSSYSSRQG